MIGCPVLRRRPRLLGMLIVISSLAMPAWALDKDPLFVPPDCGLNCLFFLLELSGHPTDLSLLRNTLPPHSPGGYSFLDLETAAKALGYGVRGVAIGKGEPAPNRPAIAFLGSRDRGHFVVIQPIPGSSGSRIQVLNPPYPPLIMDYARLTSDPHWTGRLLVLDTFGETLRTYLGGGAACLLILLPLSFRSVRVRIARVVRGQS